MPFTVAHAAAALPFRRLHLDLPALVVGTFAPDFEYFLRLAPVGRFGHTLAGTFFFTLPLGLAVLWVCRMYLRDPVIGLLPEGLRSRLKVRSKDEPRRSNSVWLVVISMLLGIFTHLVWDSFTHVHSWLYQRWHVLSLSVRLPGLGAVQLYRILQHGSTLVGMVLLTCWFLGWYRRAEPMPQLADEAYSPVRRRTLVGVVLTIAIAGALLRTRIAVGAPDRSVILERFTGEVIVTFVALIWWQMVAYAVFWNNAD